MGTDAIDGYNMLTTLFSLAKLIDLDINTSMGKIIIMIYNWNTSALGKFVSKVGKPISTDKVTATRGRLSYAKH